VQEAVMRALMGGAALLALAGAAVAEPSVEIRHAAARVTVIPEARSDVKVEIVRANPKLPLSVSKFGDKTIVDGPLGFRSPNCNTVFGRPAVFVWGVGRVRWEDLPQVVVHTPLNATVGADGAVYGAVGRGRGLALSNSGCGDWVVADQEGPVRIHTSGSGDIRGGSTGPAEIASSGSSDIRLKAVHGGLKTSIAGSGDVFADWVDGPLHANVGGSGNVMVKDGRVGDMDVSVAGSGDVKFGGVAASLEAHVAGSGDVHAGRVTGRVSKQVFGSGEVTVGR
jgi:hypothetical protein